MTKPDALPRISRVGNSFRVRVSGETAFFAPRTYGGVEEARAAAIQWRDARWDGRHRSRKITPQQAEEIRASSEDYKTVASRYGISPAYVHYLRRQHRNG